MLTLSQLVTRATILGDARRRRKPGRVPPAVPPRGAVVQYAAALQSLTREIDAGIHDVLASEGMVPHRADSAADGAADPFGAPALLPSQVERVRSRVRALVDRLLAKRTLLAPFDAAGLATGAQNREQFARQVKASLGVDLTTDPDLRAQMEAFRQSNVGLIKSLADTKVTKVHRILTESGGATRVEDIAARIRAEVDTTPAKAALLARDQVLKLNAGITSARHQSAGITSYVWRTSQDERVRETHKALEGQTFRYGEPPVVDPKTGRRDEPGKDFQCRCTAEPVIEDFDHTAALEQLATPPPAPPPVVPVAPPAPVASELVPEPIVPVVDEIPVEAAAPVVTLPEPVATPTPVVAAEIAEALAELKQPEPPPPLPKPKAPKKPKVPKPPKAPPVEPPPVVPPVVEPEPTAPPPESVAAPSAPLPKPIAQEVQIAPQAYDSFASMSIDHAGRLHASELLAASRYPQNRLGDSGFEAQASSAAQQAIASTVAPPDLTAMRFYTGSAYERINLYLREGEQAAVKKYGTGLVHGSSGKFGIPSIRTLADGAARVIAALPKAPSDMVLFRGARFRTADQLNELASVNDFESKGFFSTSRDPAIATGFSGGESFDVVYRIRRHQSGALLTEQTTGHSESEVLFAPGSRFRIVGRQRVSENQLLLDVEEVS